MDSKARLPQASVKKSLRQSPVAGRVYKVAHAVAGIREGVASDESGVGRGHGLAHIGGNEAVVLPVDDEDRHFGDLYRLVSPYDRTGVASLMYVSETKDDAVFYVYKTEHFINMTVPGVCLRGLDPDRTYRITDLTPADVSKPCALNGKTVSGRLLMEEGLPMATLLKTEYASQCLRLEAAD